MFSLIASLFRALLEAVGKFLDRLRDERNIQAGRDEVNRKGAEDALKRAKEADRVRDTPASDNDLLDGLLPPEKRKPSNNSDR